MNNEELLEAIKSLLEPDLVELTEQVAEETGIKRSTVYKVLATAFDLMGEECDDEE